MMYSFRIEQAIRAAAILHKNQFRKGTAPYPYITHLFAVACILADYTEDEDIIIAGMLHDTLEDTDYTATELEIDFGPRVREIVEGVSERMTPDDVRDWQERKDSYLALMERTGEESLMVVAADTLHNLRSVIEEYQSNPERYVTDFNGSLESRFAFYQKKSNILNRRLKNPVLHEFNHVFGEYMEFLKYFKLQTI